MQASHKRPKQAVDQTVAVDKAVDALVANRVLFPKKIEKARQILKQNDK